MNQIAYTRKEAAQALRLSMRTVDNLIAIGMLRVSRFGTRVVVPAKEVERIIRAGNTPTSATASQRSA